MNIFVKLHSPLSESTLTCLAQDGNFYLTDPDSPRMQGVVLNFSDNDVSHG